jgi:hypothetical protein
MQTLPCERSCGSTLGLERCRIRGGRECRDVWAVRGGSAPQSRLRFGGFLAAGHRGGRGGGEGGTGGTVRRTGLEGAVCRRRRRGGGGRRRRGGKGRTAVRRRKTREGRREEEGGSRTFGGSN